MDIWPLETTKSKKSYQNERTVHLTQFISAKPSIDPMPLYPKKKDRQAEEDDMKRGGSARRQTDNDDSNQHTPLGMG